MQDTLRGVGAAALRWHVVVKAQNWHVPEYYSQSRRRMLDHTYRSFPRMEKLLQFCPVLDLSLRLFTTHCDW